MTADTKHMRAIMAALQKRGFGAADAASVLDAMVELGLYPVTAADKAVLDEVRTQTDIWQSGQSFDWTRVCAAALARREAAK